MQVFEQCQKSSAIHTTAAQKLHQLQKQHKMKFQNAFNTVCDRILVEFKREPVVERLVDFVVHFVTTSPLDGEGSVLDYFISNLLQKAEAQSKAVRFRCMQIIARVMKNLNFEYNLECVFVYIFLRFKG